MAHNKTFIILFPLFFIAFSYAQNELTGTITNIKDKPVSNALIYLDSINSGVKTNKKGFYSVDVPVGTKVINVYSYKYGLLTSPIGNEKIVNFVFLDTKSKKIKVKKGSNVDIHYSEEEQKYVVRNVSNINSKDEKSITNYNTIFDFIRGRVVGVTVSPSNQIRIRGANTLVGSGEPLFIVDGSPVNFIDNILPVNVKKIKILKGPAAAIYGSRGSSGVIVITTKS